MNRRGFTLIEMLIAMTIGGLILAAATGIAISETRSNVAEEYRTQVAHRSRNLHKLFVRDILEAGNSAAEWDSLTTTESIGDTLIIRFSESDSVRYFLNADSLFRNGVRIGSNIQSFVSQVLPSGAVEISVAVGAPNAHPWLNGGNLYQRTTTFQVVPRTFYYKTR